MFSAPRQFRGAAPEATLGTLTRATNARVAIVGMDAHVRGRNHLADQSAAYLIQHAEDPVDWRPWGQAAFDVAHALDRPVFLSVGYSSCHWCHVMQRESFRDRRPRSFSTTTSCVSKSTETSAQISTISTSSTSRWLREGAAGRCRSFWTRLGDPSTGAPTSLSRRPTTCSHSRRF